MNATTQEMTMATKTTVTFRAGANGTDKATVIHRRLNDSDSDIINRAVKKLWGRQCFWWADSGLGLYYGQVMLAMRPTKNNSNPGNTSVTHRVRVDVE